ncbi:MAG: helicase-associated domain-containing protein [Candidatus Sabulitectum sp.]|nr:helicase-associated domain-containing protein [Candidatus Sabulitectum sp.]
MKLINLNWTDMLEFCYAWEDLEFDERIFFLLELKPTVVSADSFPRSVLEPFISAEFLKESSTGKKFTFTTIARQFHRLFDPLMECREAEPVNMGNLIAYLRTFYSRPEREGMTRFHRNSRWSESDLAMQVGAAAWLGVFLRCSSLSAWEDSNYSPESIQDSDVEHLESVFRCAKKLLRQLLQDDVWIPVARIPELVSSEDPELVMEAFQMLLENMLVFIEFSALDYCLYTCIWHEVYYFLNQNKDEVMESIPVEVKPSPAFLMQDMTELLIEASVNPIPLLRSSLQMHTRKSVELENRLTELPETVISKEKYTRENRINLAVREALIAEYLEILTRENNKEFMILSNEGKKWLEAPAVYQIKQSLDRLIPDRFELKKDCFNRDVWGEGNSILFSLDRVKELNKSYYQRTYLFSSAYHAFQSLCGLSEPITSSSFFSYHSQENNPYMVLFHAGAAMLKNDEFNKEYFTDSYEMEELWCADLKEYMERIMIPRGLLSSTYISVEGVEQPELVFTLSESGRYFAGELNDILLENAENPLVTVQPDFLVFFSGPRPAAMASIGKFADRTGLMEGNLLILTSSSIYRAVGKGMLLDEILETLTKTSDKVVPPAVAQQITLWVSECRRVSAETRVLITCPDEETALKVMASSGNKAVQLSETVIALPDRKYLKKVEKLLKIKGIFLNS